MGRDTLNGLKDVVRSSSWLWFHIVVITLSTGIAWSLPSIARAFLVQWSKLEHDHVFLLSVEVAVAIVLIVGLNFIGRSISDRKLTKIAMEAGLVSFFPYHNRYAEKKIHELRERHGLGRTILAIGSTGYGTFVDNEGELHAILEKSLQANIMLMNPFSEEARIRARSLVQAGVACATFSRRAWRDARIIPAPQSRRESAEAQTVCRPSARENGYPGRLPVAATLSHRHRRQERARSMSFSTI